MLSGARVLNRLPLGPAPQSPARERVTKALIGGANILNRKHNWSGSAARLDAACQEGRSEFRRDHNLLSQNCARTVVVDPSWVYCLSESSFPKLLILGTSARSEWRSWSRSILFVISRSPVQFRRAAPSFQYVSGIAFQKLGSVGFNWPACPALPESPSATDPKTRPRHEQSREPT